MTKIEELFGTLVEWQTVPALAEKMGWQPHTLRAAIAVNAKKRGVNVERRRVDGITSYRITPPYDATKDIEGSFSDAYAAIRERKEAGGPGWEPK